MKDETYTVNNEFVMTIPTDNEIYIERIINGSPELIFRNYTNQKMVSNWWGPKGSITKVEKMEVKHNGKWKFILYDKNNKKHVYNGRYIEITPYKRIAWTFNYEPFPEAEGIETVEFEEIDRFKTKIRIYLEYQTKKDRDDLIESGLENRMRDSLDRLQETIYEPFKDEFKIIKIYNSPIDKIWIALIKKENLIKWLSNIGINILETELDLKLGEKVSYQIKTDSKDEIWGIFEIIEICPPKCLIGINSIRDKDGNIINIFNDERLPLKILNSLTLKEEEDQTILKFILTPVNATFEDYIIFRDRFKILESKIVDVLSQIEGYFG